MINHPCVSIPQAVSTVATLEKLKGFLPKHLVSIPQAVSTVATLLELELLQCEFLHVSIPQAVSTVAT